MTAVANPPSFQQNNRAAWGANVGQGGLTAMNADEVARMFMPRKSAQRSNSSSSIASSSSSSSIATASQPVLQANSTPVTASSEPPSWGTATAVARKKPPQRAVPWPAGKGDGLVAGLNGKSQSTLAANGASVPISSIHQQSAIVPSQHILHNSTLQTNANRAQGQNICEGNPVLYLLSMNGTFDRKTISVPYYPDSLRIGRQTNGKTVPTPANGFFDSKVLSRQHAEIWADKNGKVWIRDVKSSNGTFVNGSRLSAENRDSEPHELQSQDHLELGIDIVSEDQKTVVHHKVAAKVEHAGYLGTTNNVLDMNFGDLDPANGTMMLPSHGPMQSRGRTNNQGSIGFSSRMGTPASIASTQMNAISQQRPMNFWLSPVTTEHIVKRLTHEMRIARLQTNELGRADKFFGTLLSKEDIKETEKPLAVEVPKVATIPGSSFRADPKPRFSDPPAPPPQQPLPEKPDVSRSHPTEQSPSLKRMGTERPRSVSSVSPVRQESTSQVITLVEALASAKKEIDIQSARLRDLEALLETEKRARELAEQVAKRFELQSEVTSKAHIKSDNDGSVIEEAFEPPIESANSSKESPHEFIQKEDTIDTKEMSDSSLSLEIRLENMLVDMQGLRDKMETFKVRAEIAESERDADRKTLSEMVEKIRSDETARLAHMEQEKSQGKLNTITAGDDETTNPTLATVIKKGSVNGAINGSLVKKEVSAAVGILSKPNGSHDPLLYDAAPYTSMLGVVLLGMGIMAYLNGWRAPKVDR